MAFNRRFRIPKFLWSKQSARFGICQQSRFFPRVLALRSTAACTIHELFSAVEIAAAVPPGGSLGRRVVAPKPARAAAPAGAPGRASTWVRQKNGLLLLEVNRDGANGLPCRYCKGQASPYYVSKGLKSLDDGHLEANLERCYTPAGRLYFATDEGKAELAQLVNYIRTHKLKPHLK